MNSTASYTSPTNAAGPEDLWPEKETNRGKGEANTNTHTEANLIVNKTFIKYLELYQSILAVFT